MAYKVILDKFYGIKLAGIITSAWPACDPGRGHNKYLQLELDPCFVDVSCTDKPPVLPGNYLKPVFGDK
jgi:hypothetical protein